MKETIRILEEKLENAKKEINDLQKQVAKADGKVEGILIAPPRAVTNNKQVNKKILNVKCDTIRPFDEKTIQEDIDSGKFTLKMFKDHTKGIADFVLGIVEYQNDQGEIERNSICTDRSRNSFYRLIHSREWELDSGASYLNNLFDLLLPLYQRYFEDCKRISRDDEDKQMRRLYAGYVDRARDIYAGLRGLPDDRERLLNSVRSEIKKNVAI